MIEVIKRFFNLELYDIFATNPVPFIFSSLILQTHFFICCNIFSIPFIDTGVLMIFLYILLFVYLAYFFFKLNQNIIFK